MGLIGVTFSPQHRPVVAMSNQYDVIVAGAGVIGASVAYHLSAKGMKVAVVDAVGPAAAASGAADGAVSVCSKRPGPMTRLGLESLRYCHGLAQESGPLSGIFAKRPSYYFSTSPQEDQALDDVSHRLADLGDQVTVLADRQGLSPMPGIGPIVHRVLEISGEGHMLGYAAVNAFLRARPLDTFWPCKVLEVGATGNSVLAHTDQGDLEAPYMVLATGGGAKSLIPALPITPRSGQLIVTERDRLPVPLAGELMAGAYLLNKNKRQATLPNPPIVIAPLASGQLLVGSTRENDGDPSRTDFKTVQRLLTHAANCYPALTHLRIIRVFAGVRAAVDDGIPIVGPLDKAPRVIVATGFEGDGICLCPLVGREIAAMIAGQAVSEDLQSLSPNRFREGRMAS
ncbi:FAD-binding oxidoreductase [Magnetospira sp. QH-2]|uniref:NAD(P)/FAD-dependent oxidoreductase n=1 Tax=Magnetospira sp. (strain QH-2) TaxID=1288970 RepID=UPI0003E815ED|nr:FAD-binding oxidoreductase [Magnetospira sp. QH-2]CCQ72140.1 FAD dependent oxidoreductase [Magnetospira sp. QH-2]